MQFRSSAWLFVSTKCVLHYYFLPSRKTCIIVRGIVETEKQISSYVVLMQKQMHHCAGHCSKSLLGHKRTFTRHWADSFMTISYVINKGAMHIQKTVCWCRQHNKVYKHLLKSVQSLQFRERGSGVLAAHYYRWTCRSLVWRKFFAVLLWIFRRFVWEETAQGRRVQLRGSLRGSCGSSRTISNSESHE